MSSLASSLAFSTLRKRNTRSSLPLKNFETSESQPAIRVVAESHLTISHLASTPLLQANENLNLVGRREAIATGVSASLLSILSLPQFANASEESCELTVSPSGLAYCDKIVGTGPQPAAGQLIKAHYVGKLENGKIFDSSYGRGKPLTFRIGVGEVIKGWDQGILGTEGVPPMLAGGKRTLRIPAELGYGVRGAGCRGGTCIIPPNSVLFFEVEFVGKA